MENTGRLMITDELKHFIEENIELIESYDLGALHVKATLLRGYDEGSLYKILREVENAYIWLQNASEVPFNFFKNEKVDTLKIPPNVVMFAVYAMYGCDVNKIICEGGADTPLKIGGDSIVNSSIKTFITKRDLLLKDATPMMYRISEFEIYKDIIVVGSPPFWFVYEKNKDIHFTVSKNSRLVHRFYKNPDESLAEHLRNVGFKNVTVV